MVALESAERAVRALRDAPVVFAGAAALGALKLPVEALRPLRITYDVYAVLALVTFLFTPALLAGLYALAGAALDGRRGSFLAGARAGYLNLLLANLARAAAVHAVTLLFTLVAVATFVLLAEGVGGLLADPTAAAPTEAVQEAASLAAVAGVVVVSVAYLGVRATLSFFLLLYKPSTAIGGNGPAAAFAESARLVWANPERALAFVLVRYFVTVLLVLPGVVALVAVVAVDATVLGQLEGAAGGVVAAAVLAVAFVVGVLELSFLATHRVAFYRALSDG
jgi:hypothetical protein